MSIQPDTIVKRANNLVIASDGANTMYYSPATYRSMFCKGDLAKVLSWSSVGITFKSLRTKIENCREIVVDSAELFVNDLLAVGILEQITFDSNFSRPLTEIGEQNSLDSDPTYGIDVMVPNIAYIHLTDRCNLTCKYCYNQHIREKESEELSQEKWLSILENLSSYGIKNIAVTGGEPLLRQDVFPAFHNLRKAGLLFSMITNATLIDKENLDWIKSVFHSVVISIDSHCKEITDNLRGKGVYEKVLQAITLLNSVEMPWHANVVLTSKNIESQQATYDMLMELGAQKVKAIPLNPLNDRADDLLPSLSQLDQYVADKYTVIRSKLDEKSDEKDYSLWYGCGAATGEFAISSNGHVFPCRLLMDQHWDAGALDGSNFRSIWENSDVLQTVRGYRIQPEGCEECIYFKHCRGGCLALQSRAGELRTAKCDYHCHFTRSIITQHLLLRSWLKHRE